MSWLDGVRMRTVPSAVSAARPSRRLAVVTCMDARIDVLEVLGLQPGDAHILRNAGGRLTDDVMRSLAISTHKLGVDTVVMLQHTGCGMAGATDAELRRLTGADVDFHPIGDHATALGDDVRRLATTPYLAPLSTIAGLLYHLETGAIEQLADWRRG